MTHPASQALAHIADIVGSKGVITGHDQEPFLTEWRNRWPGKAAMIVAPGSTYELSQIVKHCAHHKIAITPQGGNTGLVGGQIPFGHEVLILMKRIKTIHTICPDSNTICVDAGAVLEDVQNAAQEHDRYFPLSIGSEGSCQIGGVISTNAGGVNVLRYGNMRDLVLGIEAVLPNGEIWDGLNHLRKNNTGYDLKQLFIGGEGTLGIVTKAILKCFPIPQQTQTIMAACPDSQSVISLLSLMQNESGGQVSSFELIMRPCIDLVLKNIRGSRDPFSVPYPVYALIEISSGQGLDLRNVAEGTLEKALAQNLIQDAILADNETQKKAFWHIRHHISEAINGDGRGIRHDVSVPIAAIPEFLEDAGVAVEKIAPGARPIAFGHVGDGNIHYDILQPIGADRDYLEPFFRTIENTVFDIIDRHHGAISAEHGIGYHKCDALAARKSPIEINLMYAIKKAIDPMGIMNPGKLLKPTKENTK